MTVKPAKLQKGSTIGIVAPAGPCYRKNEIANCVKAIEKLGFNVVPGNTVYMDKGYLAGEDFERARDINEFFMNQDIDGIICLRGGYGSQRILDKIDYDMIRRNPKVFIGYSDITAIHSALNRICGLVTFHGPIALNFCGMDEFTLNSFLNCVTSSEPLGEVKNPGNIGKIYSLCSGEAAGQLVGGNLSLLSSSIGSPYEIDTRGKILFIEDVGEEPYRVDRMLTQLILSGKLSDCNGIVLGQWTKCEAVEPEKNLSLTEVLIDRLMPLGKPVLCNLACGHEKTKITIPLGVMSRISKDGRLFIEEGGVI